MIEDEFFIYVHIRRYGDFNTLQFSKKGYGCKRT